MKRAFAITLIFIFPLVAYSQTPEDYGFLTDGENVRWQKIFDGSGSVDSNQIIENLLLSGRCDNVQEINGKIIFDLFVGRLRYEALGYSRMRLPIYIANADFHAKVVIQTKSDRFRATAMLMGFSSDNYVTTTDVEQQALKDGRFNTAFTDPAAKIIDYNLTLCLSWLDEDRLGNEW